MRELEKFVKRLTALYNHPLDISGAREIVNEIKNRKNTNHVTHVVVCNKCECKCNGVKLKLALTY